MPIPELLVARNRGAGNVGGYELANGATLTQFGSDIAGVVPAADGADNYGPGANEIIEFKGSKYLVAGTLTADPDNRVFKFSGATWSQVHATGAKASMNDARNRTGLFIYNNGTDVELAFIYQENTGVATLVHTTDGTTWNEDQISHTSVTNLGQMAAILHKNELFLIDRSTVGILHFDLVGLTSTFYAAPWTGGATLPFEQDSNLYVIALDLISSGDWVIYKFTGAGFSSVADITTDNRHSLTARNAMLQGFGAAASIGNDVHVFVPGVGTGGATDYGSLYFHLLRTGPDTWTVTENETVIPAGLRPGARGTSSSNAEDRWILFIDTDTDPANPALYLFARPGAAPGTGTTLYAFVDTVTEMTFETASVATDYVFPRNEQGGGEGISRGTGNRAEVIDTVGVVGGMQVSYRVWGTNLAQTVKCYLTDDLGVPITQATLTGSATGGTSTRVGNEIQDVDGDDGATLYTFVIDLAGSGLVAGEPVYLKLDIQ